MGIPWKSGSSIALRVLIYQILGFGPLGSRNSLFMTMSVFRHLLFPLLLRVKSWGDRDHHSCVQRVMRPALQLDLILLRQLGLQASCAEDSGLPSDDFTRVMLLYSPLALSASIHTLCLPSYKWRNWSNEVLATHLGYTILSAKHGLSQQLAMAVSLVLQ